MLATSIADHSTPPNERSAAEQQTPSRTPRQRRLWWFLLFAVWLLSAAYMSHLLMRGWVPHDEGTLTESAERVLAGELPHRDFEEVYTGGLAYLHAFAFRALGTNLASMRIVLFVWFLAWVPTVYWVASRFASAVPAAGVTLLAVAWGLPNYAAPMPSWYNLFFATFGVAAGLRYLETSSRTWLFVAGLCGGLSFLVKSPGLYYVAGIVLALIFREQCLARSTPGEAAGRGRLYRPFVTGSMLLFVALLSALVRDSRNRAVIQFVLPGAALATLLLWREWRGIGGSDRARFAGLFRMLLPFGLGFAVPVSVFLVPYATSGALPALVRGLFVLPAKRLAYASFILPPMSKAKAMLPLVAMLAIAMCWRSVHLLISGTAAVGLTLVLAHSAESQLAYSFAWHSLDLLVPLTALAGAALLYVLGEKQRVSVLRQQQVMLVLSVTALCNVIRFPFPAPIYFCYVLPLLALAVLAVLSLRKTGSRFLLGSLLVFYLLFAVLRFTPGFVYSMGHVYLPDPETQRLTLPRAGGIRVDPREAEEYERLIPLIQQHAAGRFIYAAPDCPEVYFLSGFRNPTSTLFDFFDEPGGRKDRILNAIETHQVKVVAIFLRPRFSPRLAPELAAALAERFPYSTNLGRFQVRWRP